MVDVVLGHFWWRETLCTSPWTCRQLSYVFFFWRDGAVAGGGFQPLLPSPHVHGRKPVGPSWPLPSSFPPHPPILLGSGSVGCCHPSCYRLVPPGSPSQTPACTLCTPTLTWTQEVWQQPSHLPHGWHAVVVLWILPCHLQHLRTELLGIPQLAGAPPSQPATGQGAWLVGGHVGMPLERWEKGFYGQWIFFKNSCFPN